MGPAILQLFSLIALAAGGGYALWRVARRRWAPEPREWVWFGLAGFYAAMLGLQALVYLDWPVAKTGPWLAGMACLGVGVFVWDTWRGWVTRSCEEWRTAALFVGAALLAMGVQAVSLVGVGPERFLGKAQIDHVNYVTTAQFLKDDPFSTPMSEIGLRPWLVLPLEWKEKRISTSVAVAWTARVGGTDAQEAWGPTAVFFVGLLALALAGMWRTAAGCSPRLAAALGFAGAALPAVSEVFMLGFFAQLGTLAVFPALVGALWRGEGGRATGLLVATVFLGFLAGSYIQFWPLGVSVAVATLAFWPLSWRAKVVAAVAVTTGSLLLTSGYCVYLWDALRALTSDVAVMGEVFAGWVPGGANWTSWGRQFVGWEGSAALLAAAMVGCGMVLAWALRGRERLRWLVVFAGPLLLAARLLWDTSASDYPLHKLELSFAPICLGWAALGWLALGERWRSLRLVGGSLVGLLLVAAVVGTTRDHVRWVRLTNDSSALMERLWAAKARAEGNTDARYFIEKGGPLMGAWLAYFARASDVYYAQPAIADRRVPSETYDFRRVPAGVRLEKLDLVEIGSIVPPETIRARIAGGEEVRFDGRRAHLIRGTAMLELSREDASSATEREVRLHFGVTPVGASGGRAEIVDGDSVVAVELIRPTPVRLPVRFAAAETNKRLALRIQAGATTGEGGPSVLLQALSVEQPD